MPFSTLCWEGMWRKECARWWMRTDEADRGESSSGIFRVLWMSNGNLSACHTAGNGRASPRVLRVPYGM
jgi:hypothetical protein